MPPKSITPEEYYAGMRHLCGLRESNLPGTDRNEYWMTADGIPSMVPRPEGRSGEELAEILERKMRAMGIGFADEAPPD